MTTVTHDPKLSNVENLYWDLVDVVGGDEEIALHLVLEKIDAETLKALIKDTKEYVGDYQT